MNTALSNHEAFLQDRAYYRDIPRHVLLLPDGSRRYARKHNLTDNDVYEQGQKLCNEFIHVGLDTFNLDTLSIFFLRPSSFNLQRRNNENLEEILYAINRLALDLLKTNFTIGSHTFHLNTISLAGEEWMKKPHRIANSSALSYAWDTLRDTLYKCDRISKQIAKGKQVNFLINYSGTQELQHVIQGNEPQLRHEIGVAIRVGDAFRWSDAPIFSLGQTHMHLIQKFLPDSTTIDFQESLQRYYT